jgi:chemotaxis protein methyltransferase WspC
MTDGLRGIERLLADRIGLDPVSVGPQLISRAAHQRMNELHVDDPGAYESIARQSELELQALIDEVVVSESWFFRDEQPFQSFREYIQARWLNDSQGVPLRILSLACAAGEEPYSVAMTLWDLGLTARRFQIDAVDISARRLTTARAGIYSPNAFRGAELTYRSRHFRECLEGYELTPQIRASVNFHHANVLDRGLLAGSTPYCVVFCRNLLIYLDPRARTAVISAIDRLLAADGLLFIGHADRLDSSDATPRFTAIGPAGRFAYQRSSTITAGQSPPPLQLRPVALSSNGPRCMSISEPPSDASGPSAVLPGVPVADMAGSSRAEAPQSLLDQAVVLANQGHFDEAIAACEQQLRQKGLSAPTYFLMGMICQAAGDRRRAEECFHKTVYLDPRHDEALLALALLAERRGDHDAATGFRRRAERTMVMMRKKVN